MSTIKQTNPTMLVTDFLQLLDIDEQLLDADKRAYDSYTIPANKIFQVESDRQYHTIIFVQLVYDYKDILNVVCQCENISSPPIAINVHSTINVKTFALIE